MSDLVLSRHATTRMAQRGFNMKDAELIALLGCEVEGGYFVRDKDCYEIERILKNALNQIQRVRGKRLVVDKNVIVTAYFPTRGKARRMLRDVSERNG